VKNRPRTSAVIALISIAWAAAACASDAPPASATTAASAQPALGPFPTELVEGLRTDPNIAYTEETECGGTPCRVPGDVIAPASGADLPTVVMLGGGSTPFAERRYQVDLAVELAKRGAVVFLMSYRSAVTGNYDSDSVSDARCAVQYARASTAEYGGDPGRVVVVGHSQGGFLGLEIALGPETEAEACMAEESDRPDGVVGLGAPSPRLAEVPPDAPPVWLFAGSEDGVAAGAAERLRARGVEVEARELPGVTHDGITDPMAAPAIVDLIMEAIEST
jgi:acetyl esterase/lipase